MTYTQLRSYLSTVARCGDEGAPTSAFPVGRWLALRDSGAVVQIAADRWALTQLGFTILAHREMPATKPARQPRRTPSVGHAVQHQARSA